MFILASFVKEDLMNQTFEPCHPAADTSFTEKQGQYLAFIYAYTQINRRPPAEADMRRYFHVTPPSVHQMVIALERAGLIQRTPGKPRSIRILIPPHKLPALQ